MQTLKIKVARLLRSWANKLHPIAEKRIPTGLYVNRVDSAGNVETHELKKFRFGYEFNPYDIRHIKERYGSNPDLVLSYVKITAFESLCDSLKKHHKDIMRAEELPDGAVLITAEIYI